MWQKLNRSMARREIPYADEYRVMHPDGSVRWISGTGRFYYDDAGQPVRLPEAHRVLLFQSVRELLINASKHAGTGKARWESVRDGE